MDKTLNTNMVVINGVHVIDPSEWSWGLQDVSSDKAGRDEAIKMHKMRLGQKRTYTLGWAMIDPDNASTILKAVNEFENFEATIWDVMDNAYVTRTFYVGDRTAQMQQWMPDREDGKLFSKVGFTIIEV